MQKKKKTIQIKSIPLSQESRDCTIQTMSIRW